MSTSAQHRASTRYAHSPRGFFTAQRRQAGYRNIAWNLDFASWMQIWQESGRWSERGCGQGRFCMSRRGDVGPYSVDNVFIQQFTRNSSAVAAKRSGLPQGVMRVVIRPTAPTRILAFTAAISKGNQKVHLGVFPTAQEASLAYQSAAESTAS